MLNEKLFRTAYVVQASRYSFSAIMELCEEIKFITTGYETDEDLTQIISVALTEFDPGLDVIVPVGNVATNVLVGIIAEQVRAYKKAKKISVAFYRGQEYIIHTVEEMQWKK